MTATLGRRPRQGVRASARVGLAAYGVLHLLVAWVTVQLALGDRQQDSSGQGALRELAAQPLGRGLVAAIAVGMLAFALARAVEGCIGHRDEDDGDRLKHRAVAWGRAVLYAAIGASAVRTATQSGSSGSNGQRTLSARVMDVPGGRWLVAAVGLCVLAVGLRHLYRGLTRNFRDQLSTEGRSGESGTAYLLFGQVGYTAKGAVISLAGGLVVYAGVTHEPGHTGGLDSALQTLRDQPLGPALLVAVALGLACHGLFCFARARHLSR